MSKKDVTSAQTASPKKSPAPMSKRILLAKILDRELTKSDIDPRSKLSILDMLRQGLEFEVESAKSDSILRASANQAQDRAERLG